MLKSGLARLRALTRSAQLNLLSRRPRWRLLALLALLLVLAGLTLTHSGIASTLSTATVRQPEPFTELYFTNHIHLPKEVKPGQPITIRFAVANHENTSTHYPYRVTVVEGSAARVLEQATMTVPTGGRTEQAVSYNPRRTGISIQFIVELPDQAQAIHLRMRS